MVKSIEEIHDEFEAIYPEVARTYKPPFDQAQIDKVAYLVLDLSEHLVAYLDNIGLLDLWAKDHIIEALLRWNNSWDFSAVTSLHLTLVDRRTVSSDIKYKDEIITLSLDDIVTQISIYRSALQSKHTR